MATIDGDGRRPQRMERFGSGGLPLLPWTKQLLTGLWELLRTLMSVIYYTFMSVFQMFRFEVHLRITDETGQHIQHIQHMSTTANPTDSFLFSSLFDGDSGVMVGGSNPLSNFCADAGDPFAGKSTAEALLSSLRADDLCCGLVDDFVSRTTGSEESIFLGHHSGWNMGFPGDWNIFVSNSDGSGSSDTCRKSGERVFGRDVAKENSVKQDSPEEDRSSYWSSEEDPNVAEFDSEESKALWESLSKSSDPYNPFFFSACISTSAGKSGTEARDGSDTEVGGETGPRGPNVWHSRSDSDSSWSSWTGSEGSTHDVDEEGERLLELFCSSDPYNPMCFTACAVSSASAPKQRASLPAPLSGAEERESGVHPSSEDDEEERLWKSLGSKDDPYHPLDFQACLQSSPVTAVRSGGRPPDAHRTNNSPAERKRCEKGASAPKRLAAAKPSLPDRHVKHHFHPDKTLVPWKRPGPASQSPPREIDGTAGAAQKKVRFSPVVRVHVMRTWPFARQASRRGHWEEVVRDRDRFRRRIRDVEEAIAHCFAQPHRGRMRAYLDGASERAAPPNALTMTP